jgi:hydrogenase large subunit
MSATVTIDVPINRVEGDLEVRVELEDGFVRDAYCAGTMFRGIEGMLVGRSPLDALVIAPRICGICSTSHLLAAALALEAIADVVPPPAAMHLRNAALLTEHVQSDLRQSFLIFAPDLVHPSYEGRPLFDEARRRWEPFRGTTSLEVVRETRRLLDIIAIVGGSWPHSAFIVPGGIVSVPGLSELIQCRRAAAHMRAWFERRVLGCAIERWRAVQSVADLDAWLDERPEHRDGDLGLFLRHAQDLGLGALGRGPERYLSFGSVRLPSDAPQGGPTHLVAAGCVDAATAAPFDRAAVTEHIAYSWYAGEETEAHPSQAETVPYASGHEGKKYSWAKAPRYEGMPAETGPLAEALVARDPLFVDLCTRGGASVLTRQLARIVRPAVFLPALEASLEHVEHGSLCYRAPGEIPDGEGAGLLHAARGALGHWVRIVDGVIAGYQIVTPTGWNASPRDSAGLRGPIEEALVGTRVSNIENPIELGHVVRSFDPCLVCTVHALSLGRVVGSTTVGAW